jgi:transposase
VVRFKLLEPRIAQEFIAGETLHSLAKRHDDSRNLIRIWVKKLEAGAFDEDARAADLLQEYEAKIAAFQTNKRKTSFPATRAASSNYEEQRESVPR